MYKLTVDNEVLTYSRWEEVSRELPALLTKGEVLLKYSPRPSLTREEQHDLFVRTLDFDSTSNEDFFSKMFSDPSMLGLEGVSDGLDSDEPSYT